MRRTITLALGIVSSFGLVVGCATPEKVTLTTDGTPNYAELHVVYDVDSDAAHLDQPPSVRQVSQEDELAAHPAAGRVRLELQYPYPGLHPAFARAILRVVATRSDQPAKGPTNGKRPSSSSKPEDTSRAQTDEALVIELPKTELDGLLKDLARDGFFKRPDVVAGQSKLAVTYNRATVGKGWNREPRLDALVQMLQQHGTPVAVAPTK